MSDMDGTGFYRYLSLSLKGCLSLHYEVGECGLKI